MSPVRQEIKERRTDIALCPDALDGLCETLVDGDVLFVGSALEKEFRVGDGIVETWPEDLVGCVSGGRKISIELT